MSNQQKTKKRIVICAGGTWNKPEKDLKKDFPTNVLKLSRAIEPIDSDGIPQQVFYDWGVGSYYDTFAGGITGKGLHKNIMDDYRYIVQNYSEDDGSLLSDNALRWMIEEAKTVGLSIETYLEDKIKENQLASLHNSRSYFIN